MNELYWKNWVIRTAVTWKDILPIVNETGVSSIDEGHKALVESVLEMNTLINLIYSESFDVGLINKQKEQFEKLYNHAREQYEWEESLIAKNRIPGAERQREDHGRIMSMLQTSIREFSEGKLRVLHNFKIYFLGMIIKHINDFDRQTYRLENWKEAIIRSTSVGDIADCVRGMGKHDIDEEHAAILEHVISLNRHIEAMSSKDAKKSHKKEIEKYFDDLHKMADSHFSKEEDFISKYDMHGFKAHGDDHKKFLDNLVSYKNDILSSKTPLTPELKFNIIFQWLTHINEIDYKIIHKDRWWEKILDRTNKREEIDFLLKETGAPEIDAAFKKVLNYVFELRNVYGEVAEKNGMIIKNETVEKLFENLYYSAKELFRMEEQAIQDNGLGGLEKHKGQHEKILLNILTYKSNFHDDRIVISSEIKIHILGSLIQHLNHTDLKTFSLLCET